MDRAPAAVEEVVARYQAESKRVGEELKATDEKATQERLESLKESLDKRVSALRSVRRRSNCLAMAHTIDEPLAIRGDEIDKNPWLLPCRNGVIDLQTGKLRDGRPGDYMLKASPIVWEGFDAPRKEWEAALLTIFSDNEDLRDFVQRLCGMSLVGEVRQSVIVVFSGQGRNGKSIIVQALSDVLGPLAGAIRAEMLLDQARTASSAGPTPDIMALRGLRQAFASESDEGSRFSPSRVKWLTGNDQLTGRNPHDKYEVNFKPTHTLFLLTNHKPHAPADDFAFWERVLLVPFLLSFVDREPRADNERRADLDLPNKWRKEYPGILAWLVEGCLKWQRDGLAPPPIVKDAISDYRREEDLIADFVDECMDTSDKAARLNATFAYSLFERWWKKNVSNKVMKMKRFGTLFGRRFDKEKSGTVSYIGVQASAQGLSMMDISDHSDH